MTAPLLGNKKNFGVCFCGLPYGDQRAHAHGGVLLRDLSPSTPLAWKPADKPAPRPADPKPRPAVADLIRSTIAAEISRAVWSKP